MGIDVTQDRAAKQIAILLKAYILAVEVGNVASLWVISVEALQPLYLVVCEIPTGIEARRFVISFRCHCV